jgi:hypothetical protein
VAGLQELSNQPALLELNLAIDHGPLLFTSQGLRWGIAWADIDPALATDGMGEFEFSGTVVSTDPLFYLLARFDNSMELGVDLERLTVSSTEGSLRVAGLQGQANVEADRSVISTIGMEEFSLVATNIFDLSIHNMKGNGFESDVTRFASPVQSSMTIERIASTAPLPAVASAISAEYNVADNAGEAGYLDLAQLLRIGGIEWDLPLQNFDWRFELNHLSEALLENYAELIRQSQLTGAPNQAQNSANLAALGQDFVLQLAREEFQLGFALNANAFDGDHSVALGIDWAGLPALGRLEELAPDTALAAVRGTLAVTTDQAAIMNSPFAQAVLEYQQQGLLTIENGRVQLEATLADGELTVNGESIPLDQFLPVR